MAAPDLARSMTGWALENVQVMSLPSSRAEAGMVAVVPDRVDTVVPAWFTQMADVSCQSPDNVSVMVTSLVTSATLRAADEVGLAATVSRAAEAVSRLVVVKLKVSVPSVDSLTIVTVGLRTLVYTQATSSPASRPVNDASPVATSVVPVAPPATRSVQAMSISW